jgi:hypothetical protein
LKQVSLFYSMLKENLLHHPCHLPLPGQVCHMNLITSGVHPKRLSISRQSVNLESSETSATRWYSNVKFGRGSRHEYKSILAWSDSKVVAILTYTRLCIQWWYWAKWESNPRVSVILKYARTSEMRRESMVWSSNWPSVVLQDLCSAIWNQLCIQ